MRRGEERSLFAGGLGSVNMRGSAGQFSWEEFGLRTVSVCRVFCALCGNM